MFEKPKNNLKCLKIILKSLESLLLAIKSEYEALAIVLVPSSPIDTCINPIQPCKITAMMIIMKTIS